MKTLILLIAVIYSFALIEGIEYKARYQPAVDNVRFETYLNNPRLWALQEKCLLKDGPCDSIGRWIKARLYHGVATGECLLCTPNQAKELTKLITFLIEKKPELYEEGVRKYLKEHGIDTPAKSLPTTGKPRTG